jgi:hypothetical protein
MSNVVTPTLHYGDKRKQDEEEVVSEEYQVEFQTPTNQDDLTSSTHRTSDWRNKMKQIYTPPSEDDQVNRNTFFFSSFIFRSQKRIRVRRYPPIPSSIKIQSMVIISLNVSPLIHRILIHVSKKFKSNFPDRIKHHRNDEKFNHCPRHDIQ